MKYVRSYMEKCEVCNMEKGTKLKDILTMVEKKLTWAGHIMPATDR